MPATNYVVNADLTDSYVQYLISRNGFSDVTQANLIQEVPYVIQDLNGNNWNFNNMAEARDWLIIQYMIQQNS